MREKLLVASAYIFSVPALYIVLTEKRYSERIGREGGQALLLWVRIFLIFFAVRFLVNLIWRIYYVPRLETLELVAGIVLWGYAVYRGAQSFLE